MPTHYQVLSISPEANAEEITNGYRTAIRDVMPKFSLYPTSVLTVDKFRIVQDAYECLIKPESRAEYDATLRELAAEEQSLFGERKARRLTKDQEQAKKRKVKPPFVWNEDTNAPLFWTPGLKLIEGPKPEEQPKPVAYFKRASLEKALVPFNSTPSTPSTSSAPSTPSNITPPKTITSSADALRLVNSKTANLVPRAVHKPSAMPTISTHIYTQHPSAFAFSETAREFMRLQQAQLQAQEERHRKQVEHTREKALKELEKRKKAIDRERRLKIQLEEEARRVVEKQRELDRIILETERSRALQQKEREKGLQQKERERKKSQKQVRWDLAVDPRMDAELYANSNGWWSESEVVEHPRRNTLKKKRFHFRL